MRKYKIGRNIILWMCLIDFLIVVMHGYDYQLGFDFLLIANLLLHITAFAYFIGIAVILYGLLIKKEYRDYKFSWWDIVTIALVLLLTKDFITTLIKPHPLFHDDYWI